MTTLAIELNDAGIRIACSDGLLATEPGCALIEEEVLAVGSEAFRAARLRPHQATDRFWRDLGLDPLARQSATVRHNADIAYAQLSSLWRRFGTEVRDVVLIVPASFTREQLGLVLGMADACGMPVAGVVDAAVASSVSHPERERFHLELGLHQAVLTHVQPAGVGGVTRGEFIVLEGVGLVPLRERWIRCIARTFVSQTRFDPLHHAQAEQALYDALAGLLHATAADGTARIELAAGARTHAVEIPAEELAAAANDVYGILAGGIERLRGRAPAGLVQLGPHAASLPGMPSMLARSRNVETRHVEPEAACMGALARLAQIRRTDGRFKLVVSLRMHEDPEAGARTPTDSGARAASAEGGARDDGDP
jgi:hypothetical protein